MIVATADPYAGMQSTLAVMDVAAAHRRSLGDGVRIAVIDTGVDVQHPELAGRIAGTRNFVDSDAAQFRRDRHGTAVGGVIAANDGNGVGLIGIAPRARLLALKACWQLQPGADAAKCNSYTLAQAIALAVELRVDVINLSLTGPADPLLTALTRRAIDQGIVVVGPAVAGDSRFPAGIPGVISVISAESGDAAPSALRAPGSEVLSLAPDGHYGFFSGDSIATAAVTGVAALLLAERPALPRPQLQQLMARSTDTVVTSRGITRVINVCRVLRPDSYARDCSASSPVAGTPTR